jgi:hypothetical protein
MVTVILEREATNYFFKSINGSVVIADEGYASFK